MRTDELDYELPPELIAQQPLAERDASRLLVVDRGDGTWTHRRFAELPDLCRPGDLLVRNISRVIPARLLGRRATGGRVELLLIRRHADGAWLALARPVARLRSGERIRLDTGPSVELAPAPDHGQSCVIARSEELEGNLDQHGLPPLPPYIRRPSTVEDRVRYQTIYAARPGSSAAPTAGLHFTPAVLDRLQQKQVEIRDVVLHVGPGTFLPIRTQELAEHPIHEEEFDVPEDTVRAIEHCRARGGRVIAVGTTVVRALESAATDLGMTAGPGRTRLFIRPGHTFRSVGALLTNFHQPRSTLLALVAALAGLELARDAYRAAIAARYRFLSYGDAMLIL